MESGLSLGSNEGDRVARLREARARILAIPGVTELARSPLYETEPVDVKPEHRDLKFVNAVLVVEADLLPREWLAHAQRIEAEMGRVREGRDRNAPRPIDIDLLFLGRHCIDSKTLIVPHPLWAKRRFVLRPLADIRPDKILPGVQHSVADLLAGLKDTGENMTRLPDEW
jgi:2-amino-4-hydroxy-6-hydroxymethyldihydropteridine diphosphokinase